MLCNPFPSCTSNLCQTILPLPWWLGLKLGRAFYIIYISRRASLFCHARIISSARNLAHASLETAVMSSVYPMSMIWWEYSHYQLTIESCYPFTTLSQKIPDGRHQGGCGTTPGTSRGYWFIISPQINPYIKGNNCAFQLPFSYILPEDIPPSFEGAGTGSIRFFSRWLWVRYLSKKILVLFLLKI